MAYRFRANINLKETATGIAVWCSQQVAQRLTMAFHLNEGQANEEPSHHSPENNGRKWIADVFVPDSEWAVMDDFFTHLEAIWHHAETITIPNDDPEAEPEHEISWMDVHHCYNEINQPCGEILRYKATELPEEPGEPGEPNEYPVWVQPEPGNPDKPPYRIGDIVWHPDQVQLWICTLADGAGNNVWEPGVYGWTDIGPA